MVAGCDSPSENAPPITAKEMLESLPPDALVPLQSIAKIGPDSVACIIYPYHDGLYEGEPQAKLVNDYLASIGYHGSEAVWSIVWINSDTVSVTGIDQRDFRLINAKSLDLNTQDEDWIDLADGMGCFPVREIYAYRPLHSTSQNSQTRQGIAFVRRNKR